MFVTRKRRTALAFWMIVIRDMLEDRVIGGFVYVPVIDISQTGCNGIRLEMQEGTVTCHINKQLVVELHASHTSFSMLRLISRGVEGRGREGKERKRSGVGGVSRFRAPLLLRRMM